MVYWEEKAPYDKLLFTAAPRGAAGRGPAFADAIAAFDIETSRYKEIEQSAMYVWQFCIDFPDGSDFIIMGRTWQRFQHCLFAIKQRLQGLKLLCYVHNLSYEFQWLSGIYSFDDDEVFSLEGRAILYIKMYHAFEFRCSYKLFNMGLKEATAKYCPDYHKRSGEAYDYNERRFPDTPLTRKQLLYCVYDVWGLCKAVRAIMALFGDSQYTIPYTATGYVRREIKTAMRPYYHQMRDLWPDYECFKLLRAAFRGGNTHANRYYAGGIIHNVTSVDISSSYPSQQCMRQYPMTPFKQRKEDLNRRVYEYIQRGAACLIRCRLRNVELKYRYEPIPYIPIAKCVYYPVGLKADNGRILACKDCEIVVTDLDFKIIEEQYKFNLEVLDLYTSWYDYLPVEIRDINKKYYIEKTALKNVPGKELYYLKSKNLLNAIYGNSVMSPLRARILYNGGDFTTDIEKKILEAVEAGKDPDGLRGILEREILEKAGKRPYQVYQWGVWVTSWARWQLQEGLSIVGKDRVVYCDTDSVKFVGEADFTAYNEERKADAIAHGCFADDPKGNRHYMSVYEDDGKYLDFVTLGAKKYAYNTTKDGPHITVAGVPKHSGAVELLYKGGLPAFQPGFTWTATGKLESVYNDTGMGNQIIDGHKVAITKNIVLRPTTYKLDVTTEYGDLLNLSAESINIVHDHWRRCQL